MTWINADSTYRILGQELSPNYFEENYRDAKYRLLYFVQSGKVVDSTEVNTSRGLDTFSL